MIIKLTNIKSNINSSLILLHFDGAIWYENKMLNSSELQKLFEEAKDHLFDVINSLNGFYNIVFQVNNKYYAVIDRVRSKPLFYSKADDSLIISDSVHKIKEFLNISKYDDSRKDEFLTSGYIIGKGTLFSEIKQIEAGSVLVYDELTGNLEEKMYFEYLPDYSINEPEEYLIKKLDLVLDKAFDRLIQFADGKKIVIPLSGGFDSRLVVQMLRKKKYKNVLCFSYGKQNNLESLQSKKVAEILGYEWVFIEYTRKKWGETFSSDEFKRYFFSMDNYCSLVHIQDFIAVKELKNNKIIPEDSIFVPGHTGDFISGGHIPTKYSKESKIKICTLINDIISKHFRVNRFNNLCYESQDIIRNRIINILKVSKDSIITNKEAAKWYEFFDWKERQVKHVVNSVHIYDFFSYKWYLPLWDNDIIDYWQRISLNNKLEKYLYKRYLISFDFYHVFDKIDDTNKRSKIKQLFFNNRVLVLIVKVKRIITIWKGSINKQYGLYFTHPMQWYGMFSYFKVISKYRFQNIYSFLVDYYIKELNDK